jgi:class 3 adenylate cyclase
MVVTGTPLVDQELIIHAFAPIEGPRAAAAYEQISEIWNRCRHRLGTTEPIANTGLPTELPRDPHQTLSNRALAAQEDRTADYQAIVRREHDVVNFSMVFAAPLDTQSRRLRIGSVSPPSWIEFDRWWTELAAGGTDALLGVVRVCQAKSIDPVSEPLDVLAHEVRAVLPNKDHEPYWWQRGRIGHHGFAVWETSADDDRPDRQIVAIAREGQDSQLSAWTYSQGDVAMPPFARYLMHAAKLRYQARVRGDGQQIKGIRQRVNDRVTQLRSMLEVPSGHPDVVVGLRGLALDEAELIMTATDVREMQRTVRIAIDNMKAALANPLSADQALADWITRQLEDDAEYLDTARQRAEQISQLYKSLGVESSPPPSTISEPATLPRTPSGVRRESTRVELRMGFAIDVVGYSARSSPEKESVQNRLSSLVHEVLDELNLRLEETEHQGTGDGMNVFFPVDMELHRVLPGLLRAWKERLALDNQRYRDRLRLRMATVVGPVGVAAIGYSGKTIVEVNRLLNSEVLRQAFRERPDDDLAVLVSDRLYQDVVGEGYPGLDASQFKKCLVEVKEYRKHAWLWVAN